MNITLKQIKKIARGVRLSAEEKSGMREELFQYMKANPVRNPIHPRHPLMKRYDRIPSPFSLISKFRNKSIMPLLIILGLLMGGSASFAAESTIPGDILFPVKVHINEKVRGVVAVTPQAKAEWELHLVERRLDEIEKLATRGTASSDAKYIAQSNLEKYTARVKERISNFENEDDDEDALLTTDKLTKILRAHEAILATIDADSVARGGALQNAPFATTTIGVVDATSTEGTINKEDFSSLKEVLKTLHEVREYSEKKNKEIDHKRSSKREEKQMTNLDFSDTQGEKNKKTESLKRERSGDSDGKKETSSSSAIPVMNTNSDNSFAPTTIDTAPRNIESDTDSFKKGRDHPLEAKEKEHN
ncbi:MAG: hypothetical protein HY228_01110 [Candidatus Yonathbacteria bacterium]|nr:hypothetical protein [Candidatus Yonathbacteria bacterium]